MNPYHNLTEFLEKLGMLVEANFLEEALVEIKNFVEFVIFNPKATSRVFSSNELDAACKLIANKLKRTNDYVEPLLDSTVIIASELESFGGHIGILRDILQSRKSSNQVVILLTDLFGRCNKQEMRGLSRSLSVKMEICEEITMLGKLIWLIRKLTEARPSNLVLLTHHQDSPSIVGALIGISQRVIFIHHADHNLALGVTCEDFIHIDPHNIGFFHCRHELGIKNNYYYPMVLRDRISERKKNDFLKNQYLVTCSSGREAKFEAGSYQFDYFEMIPKVLAITGGQHVHIGPLGFDKLKKIICRLDNLGIDPKSFVHIQSVPSLAEALLENDVDLYISSFPLGGGKALVEAMAVGIPCLVHQSYKSRFEGGQDLAYPEAWVWTDEIGFTRVISEVSIEKLKDQSMCAKNHFYRHHSTVCNLFEDNFLKAQTLDSVPSLRPYLSDPLRVFLDDQLQIEGYKELLEKYESQAQKYESQAQKYESAIKSLLEDYDLTVSQTNAQLSSIKFLFVKFLKLLLWRALNVISALKNKLS